MFTLTLALCACRPSPARLDDTGAIDFIAVFDLDGDTVVEATGLIPWDPAGTTVYTASAHAYVAGYTRALLTAAHAPADSELRAGALRPALGCEAKLPQPSYLRELHGDTVTARDPALLPAMTALWADTACDDIAAEALSFDTDCSSARCASTVTKTAACRFDVELACDLGLLDLRVGPTGDLCVDSARSNTSCAATSSTSVHCTNPACTIDVHRDPQSPLFTLTARTLRAVAPFSPPQGLTGNTFQMPKQGRYLGYAYDFAVLDSGAIAVSFPPTTDPSIGCFTSSSAGTLELIDPETLEATATSTTPSCTTLLGVIDGELYGVHVSGAHLQLSALERAPGSSSPRARTVALEASRASCYRPIALFTAGDRVAVVVDASACNSDGSFIYTFARSTLAPLDLLHYPDASAFAADLAGDHTLVLGDSFNLKVIFADLDSGTRREVVIPRDIARNDDIITDTTYVPALDRTVVSLGRNKTVMHRIGDMSGIEASAVFYEVAADPIAAHLWPKTGRPLLAIAGTARLDPTTWPASLGVLDAAKMKMMPGAQPLGHGAVRRIAEDRQQRLWLLLPWEPKLVRVTVAD